MYDDEREIEQEQAERQSSKDARAKLYMTAAVKEAESAEDSAREHYNACLYDGLDVDGLTEQLHRAEDCARWSMNRAVYVARLAEDSRYELRGWCHGGADCVLRCIEAAASCAAHVSGIRSAIALREVRGEV